MEKKRILLGEILVKKKLISPQDLQRILSEQKKEDKFLGALLIEKGFITERQLLEALSEQLDVPMVNIHEMEIDWTLAKRFSRSSLLKNRCFPLQEKNDKIILAVTNPLDAWAISEIEKQVPGYKIKVVLVSTDDIETLSNYYHNQSKGEIRRLFDG